jgi:hypothetical protein
MNTTNQRCSKGIGEYIIREKEKIPVKRVPSRKETFMR